MGEWETVWIGDTSNAYTWEYSTSVKYVDGAEWSSFGHQEAREESALEWLDRRVDEIRVAL